MLQTMVVRRNVKVLYEVEVDDERALRASALALATSNPITLGRQDDLRRLLEQHAILSDQDVDTATDTALQILFNTAARDGCRVRRAVTQVENGRPDSELPIDQPG